MRGEFTAILRPGEEGGFIASCAEFPGTEAEAETEREAIENLVDAVSITLEFQREETARMLVGCVTRQFRISADFTESALLQMEEESVPLAT
ncbi:MAG: hypothetical protein AAGJ31_05610 [Verrucomicrobiota bacterium]